MGMRTLIIAEIGECFNGSMENAFQLIEAAKKSGCDIAKFQTLDADNIADDDPERDWFYRIALDSAQIALLVAKAREAGIGILFTPENIKTAGWLKEAGLDEVKIASSCAADLDLIDYIAANFSTVYMSTGMASLDDVNNAVRLLAKVPDLYIMHCISEYPTGALLEQRGLVALSPANVRLNMMKMLMELYPQYKIGYSDHTDGILAPIAAVAMGAQVIEKHITLDRQTPIRNYETGGEYLGTDHVLSLEPPELEAMVRGIREVEEMLGEWKWQRTEGELILRQFLRERFADS